MKESGCPFFRDLAVRPGIGVGNIHYQVLSTESEHAWGTVNLPKNCQLIPPGGLNLFLIQGTNID